MRRSIAIAVIASVMLLGCYRTVPADHATDVPEMGVVGRTPGCKVYAVNVGGGILFVAEAKSASSVCSVATR